MNDLEAELEPEVIGIDPSLTATGLACHDGETRTVTYPRGCDGDQRLAALWEQLEDVLPFCPAEEGFAVVEDLPTHAHGAGITGMAHGVVRLLLVSFHVPYVVVTPATLKKFATGKGNATKADMRMALYQRAGLDLRDDNQVDAWWLRQIGLHRLALPNALPLPKTHVAALEKVRWPMLPEQRPVEAETVLL